MRSPARPIVRARQPEPYFSDIHFKVASQRSCPRCNTPSSILRMYAAAGPLPSSSVTARQPSPTGVR